MDWWLWKFMKPLRIVIIPWALNLRLALIVFLLGPIVIIFLVLALKILLNYWHKVSKGPSFVCCLMDLALLIWGLMTFLGSFVTLTSTIVCWTLIIVASLCEKEDGLFGFQEEVLGVLVAHLPHSILVFGWEILE